METNKIVIIKSKVGKFAFTRDDTNNLIYQELGKFNDLYFSTDKNQGGNLSDDWNIVDFMGLDEPYKNMVEKAIKELN